jgi:hypothetical protein
MSRVSKHEVWLQELLSEYINIMREHEKEDLESITWEF